MRWRHGFAVGPAIGTRLLMAVLLLALAAGSVLAAESSSDLEGRLEAALAAADAALDSEEARLDDLAARHSRRTLADGRPSSAQAAANVRLWERRIRELEASERELRETLDGVLASLGAELAALTGQLSARLKQAEQEKKAREQAEREETERRAREQAAREKAERERAEREKAQSEWAVGRVFRDCPACPEMMVVPAGSYMMGSPPDEAGHFGYEDPVHRVTIGQKFAVGVYEVTRGEFARFVRQTNRAMGNTCWTYEDREWGTRSGRTWRNPGFSQRDDHSVVCVSWQDAEAYVRWLSRETGERYRLLSESEWEYVARAGTRTSRYWGTSESGQCRHANGGDASTSFDWGISCNDGYARTSPVGSYTANGFGLYDVLGNVWEWTQDCWNASYRGAPNDGRAWERGDCGPRVVRGGAWSDIPGSLRSAVRYRLDAGDRSIVLGFRLARTLTPLNP